MSVSLLAELRKLTYFCDNTPITDKGGHLSDL